MKDTRGIFVLILGVLVIAFVIIQPASCYLDRDLGLIASFERPPWRDLLPYMLLVKIILSSTNTILLLILLAVYLGIYRRTGSKFSVGLVIFTMALLLYAITSNPLIHTLAGFRLSGLGPFTMLPDLFTCIASAILLYLSQQ